jgi:hypothetical protein
MRAGPQRDVDYGSAVLTRVGARHLDGPRKLPLQSLYFDRAPEQIVRSSALSPTVPPTLFVRADEVIE